jgi:hypothetical protein
MTERSGRFFGAVCRVGVCVPLALAAGASSTVPTTPTGGPVSFSCGFETSWSACGFTEQAKQIGSRASIVKVARDGSKGVRLLTQPGDSNVSGSGDWERNDLYLSPAATACSQGEEGWWAMSVLFPQDYVVPPSGGGVVMDFHHTGSGDQANFHLDAMPNPMGMRLRGFGGAPDTGRYEITLGPLVKNRWYDFVYHVRWSSASDGFMEAWMNGKKVLVHKGPTLYSGQQCYLKLANYHTAFGQPSAVIHDRIIRGTSAAAVALTPLQGLR